MVDIKKYNEYKRKMIEGLIDIPFDLSYAGGLRAESVTDYYNKYNDHIDEVMEKEEITDEEVMDILYKKRGAASEFAYDSATESDKNKTLVEKYEKAINEYSVAMALVKNPKIVTHVGDDLDNRSSKYVLENWAKKNGIIGEDESLEVERVPAGKTKEGFVNVDTGGHQGSTYKGDTIIIDGDNDGAKSAIEEISNTFEGIEVPKQIIECADKMPRATSIFDTRSGISLQKYATIENVFKMAEDGALTKSLTDEELEKYDLIQKQREQQKTIDEAKSKVEKYMQKLPNGENVVIAPEQIAAGSLISYELGANYYASISDHKSGKGVTFSINAKFGNKLPDNIKEYGETLVNQLKREDGSSDAFLHPNGSMFTVGGPKNPDAKLDITNEEAVENITKLFDEYAINDMEKKILSDKEYFKTIPDEIKIKYPQLCKIAVTSKYYYDDYDGYEELGLGALEDDGESPLQYVPEEVQVNHPEICKEAVKQNRHMNGFDDYGFWSRVVTSNWWDSGLWPQDYVTLEKQYDNALKYVPENVLRKNPDILLDVEKNGYKLLKDVPADIFLNNIDMVKNAVRSKKWDLNVLPDDVKEKVSKELVKDSEEKNKKLINKNIKKDEKIKDINELSDQVKKELSKKEERQLGE